MSDFSDVDKLIKYHLNHGNSLDIAQGVNKESISLVEAKLNIIFCEDYVHFLQRYGALCISDVCVSGVFDGAELEESEGCVHYDTITFYSEYPEVRSGFTVFNAEENEAYELLDHSDSKIYFFDPFSKSITPRNQSVPDAICDILETFK
ncbi:SMI1/KNR4 family protein [Marinagarivorans algicola]|uniref:SMI1/KNR4 family protein n=1 Tax=Marinagarivorans algicola TaxID=1513270 RepID=UPI0006B44D9E|nr:SMI1/KNR4 family protein [Marinagarivorans algicola]